MNGEKLDNDSLKGKVVLLQFWATWCGYCRRDQPAVERIVEDYSPRDLVVVAVNVGESRKKVEQYLKSEPRTCKIVLNEDTNLPAVFQAQGFPMYVLIDRTGKIAGVQRGAGGDSALRQLIGKAGLEPAR